MEKPERIIVLGTGKSGTTALYFRIKNSILKKHVGIFEPKRFEDIQEQSDPKSIIITKALIIDVVSFLEDIYNFFNKKILIVRDPRDTVISTLLYTGSYHYIWQRPEEEILDIINLLRNKEKNPGTIAVLELFRCMWDSFDQNNFSEMVLLHTNKMMELANSGEFFIIKYEDLIGNNLSELENYLGLKITRNTGIDEEFSRVIRTKGSGSWGHWFLNEDIDYFKPMFSTAIEYFGYDMNWATKNQRIIKAQHSSEYVKRIVNEKRKNEGFNLI